LEAGDEVSRAVFESAIAEVNVPDKQWRLGDYEILDEIGRGGMGVIYLARQRHPQRIVAVKRVLNYHADSHETLKRFRREADAAASLDHPNILPIYEVSESEDGLPFFSMKFATGGSLQKVGPALRGKPRECAQVMAKVARAVEYAHGHGILHRDLKPGNILLDDRGEPLVSDFGLAKWLDANKDLTKSLTTFGTPGYTAPEQAEGAAANLTPAADVYSLGAIVFELLAGRPPFLGDNAVAVIRQAAETPAPKLRSLAHSHDRDLETICARCLERDPKARYQSAGDLATDLERWLDGRPIIARPISVLTRVGRWSRRNPKLIATGAACLLFGAATMWFFRGDLARVLPPPPEKSIAVLPFENLSGDPDNAYFADGIQEEILTRLAGIADLKVISHTSTQRYQSKPRNLRDIAKQLGVANIVEGSVQKAVDQIRVNVQLVNAQTDSHLWANTYDRKLTDVLSVESDIAKRIAESLQAKISGSEKQALAVKPTNNPEAYDAYLRGLAFQARMALSTDVHRKAIGFFERAVQLDPNFSIAWARLSRADANLYFETDDTTPARRDAAKAALENAQKLEPNSSETLLALGYYQYLVLADYAAAKTTFERVGKMSPGSSEVPSALGRVARRAGHWDEAIAYHEQALGLDPRNVELLFGVAWTYTQLRQFAAALKLYDRILDITPNDPPIMAFKAAVYQAQGNLQGPAGLLADVNAQTNSEEAFATRITQLRLERNFGEAVQLLQARQAQFHFQSEYDKAADQVLLALTKRLAGDAAGAKVTAEQARNALERLYREQPGSAFIPAGLSQAYALMGEKDSALTEAERATTLLPRSKDAVSGPCLEESLAFVQTISGENSHAISTLSQLLQTAYNSGFYRAPITPALLRLDPIWDSLRADPAFQKLCEEKIDKSIAVLPFENLSGDPNNAYFAEGIQEEILTRLAGIADLKVISRSSTQRYQSKPRNLGEIAKQLGVANILEGSVQKTADEVRVNVQLINAQTDSHLWAETYDRKLTDIFGVESEIAKRIAESLQAKLTGREELTLAFKATKNLDAYDAYLRGLAFQTRTSWHSDDALRNAIDSYEKAVQLDSAFAPAWARLARAHAWKYERHEGTVLRRDAATKALDNAQKLQPDSPETLLALGYYQRFVLDDWEAAKTTFRRVGEMLPSSSEVPMALGRIARNEGQWDDSNSYFERALSMDPRNVELLAHAAFNYTMLRQFPTALKLFDRALDLVPHDSELLASKAGIYQAQGNLKDAVKLLPQINEQTTSSEAFRVKITQMRLERRFDEAVHLLQTRLAQFRFFSEVEKSEYQVMLSFHLYLAGNRSSANFIAKQARDEIESQLEGSLDWNNLALANAVMGNKDLALKAAEHAGTLVPTVKDRVNGPSREEWLALIQTIVGENGHAISILTRLVQTPYLSWLYGGHVTPALLRLDPIWDPLRGDPAFQKLCEEKQPPAIP
jgi:TolB-like protein/Tfp pilus assembly protein PilF/tRNA A-37 threonylcarbamoyl transferase component Bud32